MSRFLLHATSQNIADVNLSDRSADEPIPLWFFSSSFKTKQAFNSFSTHLTLHRTSKIPKRDIRLWGTDGIAADYANTFPFFKDSKVFDNANFNDLDRVLLGIEWMSSAENAYDDQQRTKVNSTFVSILILQWNAYV